MNKKHEHNAKLIMTVKEVRVVQTLSNPPRTLVIAQGEARTNATNARLVLRKEPSIPETLQLDFEADHGHLQVITPVTAVFELDESHGFNQVTVHAETNRISREVPPSIETRRAVQAFTLSANSTTAFMALETTGSDTVTIANEGSDKIQVTVQDKDNKPVNTLFTKDGVQVCDFEVPGASRQLVTVQSHRADTVYALAFQGAVEAPVKGYIKVKGSNV